MAVLPNNQGTSIPYKTRELRRKRMVSSPCQAITVKPPTAWQWQRAPGAACLPPLRTSPGGAPRWELLSTVVTQLSIKTSKTWQPCC